MNIDSDEYEVRWCYCWAGMSAQTGQLTLPSAGPLVSLRPLLPSFSFKGTNMMDLPNALLVMLLLLGVL